MKQPVAKVSAQDVDRIVRREFPASAVPTVTAALNQFGGETSNPERHRVHAAILKLANGRLGLVRSGVITANRDFRDVICDAEYPRYMREIGARKVDAATSDRIIQSDWEEYVEWLGGGLADPSVDPGSETGSPVSGPSPRS